MLNPLKKNVMRFSRFILAAVLAMCGLTAQAQEAAPVQFHPHPFLQLQAGGAYTLGEADFNKLLSLSGGIAVGYQFSPAWALRLSASGNPFGTAGKGGFKDNTTWGWKYIAPTLDVKFNLVDAIKGYSPTRVFSFNIIAGVGANIAWGNDKAAQVSKTMYLNELWDGTKVLPVGRAGVGFDFRVCRRVSLTTEFLANATSEKFNSKARTNDKNPDWYFTGMLGLRIGLGKVDQVAEAPVAEPTFIPYVAEEPKPEPVKPPVKVVPPTHRTEVFYAIRQTELPSDQQQKIAQLVEFLKKHPETRVEVTGYADAGTGNPKINMMYAKGRAENVAKALTAAGIDAARITVDAKGDTVQPFAENDMNRVTIAIAE
jgi:outer membrane protein OmpA-like peptidoglycan-associated protein